MEFPISNGIPNFEMENFKVIFKLTWNFPFNLWNFPDKMEHEFISFHCENGAYLHFPFSPGMNLSSSVDENLQGHLFSPNATYVGI